MSTLKVTAAFLRALLQAQGEVDAMNHADDDGLPGHQVPEPVQQLAVQDVGLLPAGRRGGIKDKVSFAGSISFVPEGALRSRHPKIRTTAEKFLRNS